MADVHACLGIMEWGNCAYNPAQPNPVYFTLGNAIAALGFTLAIQQFLKPIYLFRVRVYGLRIIYLSVPVFVGALCSVVAMLLPNIPIAHDQLLAYPILWELAGGFLIGAAYFAAALISLTPVRVNSFNLLSFVRAAATLLSSASDDDRASFAEEVLRGTNIEKLIQYASAWKRAEMHAIAVEMERIKEIGASQKINGRPPLSAFYVFAHRRELEAASHAGTLLRILSDPDFCSVLVRKCAWATSALLEALAEKRLYAEEAESFVQEVATQAIANDESMITKEASYTGFSTVPLLSKSLFGNWFILNHYKPLQGINFLSNNEVSDALVKRLNSASKMMLGVAIKSGGFWHVQYMYGVEKAYEHLSRQWQFARAKKLSVDYTVSLHVGIADLCKDLQNALEHLPWERKESLYVTEQSKFRNDLVENIASIVYESFASVANEFIGGDDAAWPHVIMTYMEIFPRHSTSIPAGMNPLQQQLAVKIVDKLRHNMGGWYPAISRIMLAVIGPYESNEVSTTRTAHVILRDAVYRELQNLPSLYAKSPEKIGEFLPTTVSYDPASNTLTHSYRLGQSKITALSTLTIPEIDLHDSSNWRTPPIQ